MIKKTTIILTLLLVILGAITIVVLKNKGNSTLSKSNTDFAVKDTQDITKIFMADMKGHSVTLDRIGKNWIVNGKYEINEERLNLLLETIYKIEVREPIPLSAMDHVIREMSTNSVKVEIYKRKKKPAKVYYVGGATPDFTGTYMALDNKKNKVPFVIHIPGFLGYLSEGYYFTDEVEWRTKIVLNYNPTDISSVTEMYYNTPKQSFTLIVQENGKYNIKPFDPKLNGIDINPLKIKKFLMGFSDLQFVGIYKQIKKDFKDSLIASRPAISIIVKATNNKNTILNLYYYKKDRRTLSITNTDIDPDYFYAYSIERPGEIFVMQTMILKRILWSFDDFKK